MAAPIASLRAVMSVLLASGIGPVCRRSTIPSRSPPRPWAPARSSALLEPLDRHGPSRLEPDPAARDVSNLGGHGERADLVAHDVDPADFAERQRGRGGDRQPQTVAARVLDASEEGLVVDPEAHGPRDGKPRMAAALGGRAHRPNRLTRPRAATAARWVDEDEAQCPSEPY